MDFHRVGVVGCGIMGAGIVHVCAVAGLDVRVATSTAASVQAARERVGRSLENAVRRGRLTGGERDAALARIAFTADLTEFADRQFVVESVTELESVKVEVLALLDKIVGDPAAVFATNTSSIPVVRLAQATNRPDRVLGVHFFNPVPALSLAEMVPSLLTSAETYQRAETFVTTVLGKQVVRAPDRAGFVVNGLLIPYLLAAVRMVESGFATAEDVDRAMTLGCAHPMGPLRLVDHIGLDTVSAIARSLYEEFGDPSYAVPPLLARMVEGGMLGRKCGRGFYGAQD